MERRKDGSGGDVSYEVYARGCCNEIKGGRLIPANRIHKPDKPKTRKQIMIFGFLRAELVSRKNNKKATSLIYTDLNFRNKKFTLN